MSKTKRKRYTGAFKAKVGLEALMGIKTVGQIAREYQVHPVQVPVVNHGKSAFTIERGMRIADDGSWERAFLGRVRYAQGRYAEARSLLADAVARAPANLEYVSELARATRAADSVAARGR
jgi:hypothetical protein